MYDFHARAVADVMDEVGFSTDAIADAQWLIHKKAIKVDAEGQAYEDAVGLAFLEVRLGPFMLTVSEEQLSGALRRTWEKMSEAGRTTALTLRLAPEAAEMLTGIHGDEQGET